jgi:septal ring factor EnvC (AmiA/AmiB activator)
MEQSPLVQRAIRRLHDGIARREMNLDLEAIKAVLVEMATQKERADELERVVEERNRELKEEHDSHLANVDHLHNRLQEAIANAARIEQHRREADDRARKVRDLISQRLEAYSAAHSDPATGVPPPGYRSGFYQGMSEALDITLTVLAE